MTYRSLLFITTVLHLLFFFFEFHTSCIIRCRCPIIVVPMVFCLIKPRFLCVRFYLLTCEFGTFRCLRLTFCDRKTTSFAYLSSLHNLNRKIRAQHISDGMWLPTLALFITNITSTIRYVIIKVLKQIRDGDPVYMHSVQSLIPLKSKQSSLHEILWSLQI